MKDVITLYTTVKPALYRRALFIGSATGGLAAIILILSTLFIPPSKLEWIGPVIGLFSLVLIGVGYRPFLLLRKIDSKPTVLKLFKDEILLNHERIPVKNIKAIRYIDRENSYGIDRENSYGIEVTMKAGQILFLPYYSKSVYEEVLAYLDDGLNAE